jgi:hypothetical protein
VTVVAVDTPNERVSIEASVWGSVALTISSDVIIIVHRMFLTTPSSIRPLRAHCQSNGCALALGRTQVKISEGFRDEAPATGGARLSDRLLRKPFG